MKKTIYLKYAKDHVGRSEKIQASFKKNFSQIKSQPYDKDPLHTVFLEVEIDLPDDIFRTTKIAPSSVNVLNEVK